MYAYQCTLNVYSNNNYFKCAINCTVTPVREADDKLMKD